MSEERSCALIVIGNEILSGKIRDSNSYFAACELRSLGVALQRITVIPDELHEIAEEVRLCARRFDVVLTSGGVGPTHDDITMAGVAAAFEQPLVRHPELEALIRGRSGDRVTAASLKMAEVPEGAVLNHGGEIAFPTVQVDNVYILPGIPELFEAKLRVLAGRFATDPYFIRAIYLNAGESAIAAQLNLCLERFPAVMLGSYPKLNHAEYRVRITLESKDRGLVEQAFNFLLGLLPPDAVIKAE